jgi:hypothetical protein
MIGSLPRTCGIDAGALAFPVLAGPNSKLYESEKGFNHLDFSSVPVRPFIESGPMEIGDGGDVMYASQIIPDEKTLGDAQFYLYSSLYPSEIERLHGPFVINKITGSRVTGRAVRIRAQEVNAVDWRLGTLRLDAKPAGRR